jgi:hypothetical protein
MDAFRVCIYVCRNADWSQAGSSAAETHHCLGRVPHHLRALLAWADRL